MLAIKVSIRRPQALLAAALGGVALYALLEVSLAAPDGPIGLGPVLNDLSERLGGRERRFCYGEAGRPRLPDMRAVEPNETERSQLARTRLYVLPGHPWPGVAGNGTAWVGPWTAMFERLGIGSVVPVPYTQGWRFIDTVFRAPLEPLLHAQAPRALSLVRADLQMRPLGAGERVVLFGHSYGAHIAALTGASLKAEGVPVAGLVMLETRLPDLGRFVAPVPDLPVVVEIENDPASVTAPAGVDFVQQRFPELSHMEMVLQPTAKLVKAVVAGIAR